MSDHVSNNVGEVSCKVCNDRVVNLNADTILVPNGQTSPGQNVFVRVRQNGAIAGCDALSNFYELSSGVLSPGSVLTVESGGGNTSHLSHVGSICELAYGKKDSFKTVVVSVLSALEDMKNLGLHSINMPLLSTGRRGWLDDRQSLRAMLIGIDRFTQEHTDYQININFCVPDKEKYEAVKDVINDESTYRNVSNKEIIGETSNKNPTVTDLLPYKTNDPLTMSLPREASKFRRGRSTGP